MRLSTLYFSAACATEWKAAVIFSSSSPWTWVFFQLLKFGKPAEAPAVCNPQFYYHATGVNQP